MMAYLKILKKALLSKRMDLTKIKQAFHLESALKIL